jgi:hypothetical protein
MKLVRIAVLIASLLPLVLGAQAAGKVTETALGVLPTPIHDSTYSADGLHAACVVAGDSGYSVWLDGKLLPGTWDAVREDNLVFSPNGGRFCFTGIKNNKAFLVIDGRPGAGYDDVYAFTVVFSPDGQRVAGVVQDGDGPARGLGRRSRAEVRQRGRADPGLQPGQPAHCLACA